MPFAILRESDVPSSYPHEFGRFRLLRWLGQGWVSNVFLAELLDPTASPIKLPKTFALKVAVDRTHRYAGQHTIEKIEACFESQHSVGRAAKHPLIAEIYSDATPEEDRKYELISEAGVLSVGKLQELAFLQSESAQGSDNFKGAITYDVGIEAAARIRRQALPLPFVRYLAAQLCLAVGHLHSKGLCWGDPQHDNIVIMSDFTMRIIDVHEADGVADQQKRDREMMAGFLYNLVTGDPDFLFKGNFWLLERFSMRYATAPLLFDMLEQLLLEESFQNTYSAKFWLSDAMGPSIDFSDVQEENIFDSLSHLKEAAWGSLGEDILDRLSILGVDGA